MANIQENFRFVFAFARSEQSFSRESYFQLLKVYIIKVHLQGASATAVQKRNDRTI